MTDDTQLRERLELTARQRDVRVGGRYRHYRTGGVYEVVALALRESDHEPTVVYRGVESGLTWTRTLEDFVRRVNANADGHGEERVVRRFEPLDPWEYPEAVR